MRPRSISLMLALVLSGGLISCAQNVSYGVGESIVQIWSPAQSAGEAARQVSSGVVAGDGTQVLALLNYEDYSPGPLEVITSDDGKYQASIRAIDPRTGMTVLSLEDAKGLRAAGLGAAPVHDQTILTWEWNGANWAVTHSLKALWQTESGGLFFTAGAEGALFGPVLPAGTVVTDTSGSVIGLAMPLHDRLALRTAIPPSNIAAISEAVELLKPDIASAPRMRGPALSVIAGHGMILGNSAGLLPPPSDYDSMTRALLDVFGQLGEPLPTNDLNLNNRVWYADLDATMLLVVYPRPVELRSSAGKVLASAKWVGIEWNRGDRQPNRLVYGSSPYFIEGGYELPQDLSVLQGSLPDAR